MHPNLASISHSDSQLGQDPANAPHPPLLFRPRFPFLRTPYPVPRIPLPLPLPLPYSVVFVKPPGRTCHGRGRGTRGTPYGLNGERDVDGRDMRIRVWIASNMGPSPGTTHTES